MKNRLLKYVGLGCASAAMFLTSCEDFLNRPDIDNFTAVDAYQNESQLAAGVESLYRFPWFDWQRGMLAVGDALGGNYYKGEDDVYTTMNTSGFAGDAVLSGLSQSLWAIISQVNGYIYNLNNFSSVSNETNDKYIGEAMVMQACAYFYLVRTWGDIPIISSNQDIIAEGSSFELGRYKKEDVYKYIISSLIEAARLLPEENQPGRIDKYSAYGLLSKVYLTAAGVTGTLNKHYLEKSIEYGSKVYNCGHHQLEPSFPNLFRISTGDNNQEGLVQMHWICVYDPYAGINMQHCDLVPGASFNGTGSGWGQWCGATIDLLDCFGVDPFVYYDKNKIRPVDDARRLAVATMYQDYQPWWYRDQENATGSKGFYVEKWGESMDEKWGFAEFQSPTGALAGQKNIHGNVKDHVAECGKTPQDQGSCTPIYYLRAADVYLCMAEAQYLLNGTVSGEPLDAINKVHERSTGSKLSSVDFDVIWNERRKELAFEGDMWFNYVKLSYYDPQQAKVRLANVERGRFGNVSLKDYYAGAIDEGETPEEEKKYNTPEKARKNGLISVKKEFVPVNQMNDEFSLPYPEEDIIKNPNLMNPSQNYDLKKFSYYDESKI